MLVTISVAQLLSYVIVARGVPASPIVRRGHEVQLEPDGHVVHSGKLLERKHQGPEEWEKLAYSGDAPANCSGPDPIKKEPTDEECGQDFVLGFANTNCCGDAELHSLITDRGTCRDAAANLSFSIEEDKFEIDQSWFEHRPRGCFAYKCGDTSLGDVCVYYNAIGPDPAHPEGAPMCYRSKYINGTNLTGAAMDAPEDLKALATAYGCPDGYEILMDRSICEAASGCRQSAPEGEFIVGAHNKSLRDFHPLGCHIGEDGKYFFNPEVTYNGEPWWPGSPTGTPVCVVAQEAAS